MTSVEGHPPAVRSEKNITKFMDSVRDCGQGCPELLKIMLDMNECLIYLFKIRLSFHTKVLSYLFLYYLRNHPSGRY